jgi:hypothetical protein
MYRKMGKDIHGNCVFSQHAFSAYRTTRAGNPSAPFEKA